MIKTQKLLSSENYQVRSAYIYKIGDKNRIIKESHGEYKVKGTKLCRKRFLSDNNPNCSVGMCTR